MRMRSDEAKSAILKVLSESGKPLGASQIVSALLSMGVDLQPRTVRYYLLKLDAQGFTKLVSRRMGREITERGREEISRTNAMARMGIVAAKVDSLGYKMSFNVKDGKGTIIINVSLIDPADFRLAIKEIQLIVNYGFSIGGMMAVAQEGAKLGSVVVPEGSIAIGTVCSVTLNGIFQKEGIPVVSRFGGLLEIKDRKPIRFVNMIEYRGSTLDPLEVFIRADMTRVRSAVLRGSGIVCASFREIPSVALDQIRKVERAMKVHGLGGILAIGRPSQPLFDISVSEGYCGMVVLGGLNPIAAVREAGVRVSIQSLAGLLDFNRLIPVHKYLRHDTGYLE
ncbi:MAG: NrpR regulatory domain-containing protein [Kiritimatiellae bacterium]|nr:NrpR regulatory domain-containing protein [Kiritimatiellia bacterium]MDD5521081.1 NrpR regulatory domain-containing protein [Kiritimatiellia bacterium]